MCPVGQLKPRSSGSLSLSQRVLAARLRHRQVRRKLRKTGGIIARAATGRTGRLIRKWAANFESKISVPKRCRRSSATKTSSRSEEHTSELQSPCNLVCRLLLEKKKGLADVTVHHGAAHPQ